MLNLTRRIAVFAVIALVISVGSSWAQSDRGTITGTVVDSAGARVAGAAITATQVATGVSTKTVSDKDGIYSLPSMQIGTYTVTVDLQGFKTLVQQGVVLNTGATVSVNVTLQVGGIKEVVQVTSAGPQIQAATTELSTTATSALVSDLPLFSQGEMRNPGFFMVLDSSVSSRGNSFGGGGGFNDRSLSTTIAGSPSAASQFHVDGLEIASGTNDLSNFRIIGFPQDAVAEFSLSTIGSPADLGHTGGGVTSFTLKSGSNQLHGSAYEYLRNSALDARGFFNPSVSPLRQNEFGATAGGRIIKDKLFFFGWYDGFRISAAASNSTTSVTPQAFRQGDFSKFIEPVGPGLSNVVVPIYNPYTNASDGAGGTTRTQFPGNIINIPQDKVSQAIMALMPLPSGPTAGNQVNNYLVVGANTNSQNEYGGKIDYQMTAKNRMSGSFSYSNQNQTASVTPFAGPLSESAPSLNKLPVIRFSDDYLISSNVVNHFSAGFNRWASGSLATNTVAGGWPAKLGFAGVPLTDGAMPIINGFDGVGQFGGAGGNPSVNNQNNTEFTDSVNWVKGKHSLKFGMEFIREGQNSISTGRASGYLFTANQLTGLPDCTPTKEFPSCFGSTNGSGTASFLIGQMDQGTVNYYNAPVLASRNGYWAGYAQDDFKYSSKLTFNLGMRWDVYEPSVDAHNAIGWMNPSLPNPAAGGILGVAQFASAQVRSDTPTPKHDISPRIGLAYAINDKTVIRSSFSILFGEGGYHGAQSSEFNYGYNGVESLNSINNDLTATWTMAGGWPSSRFSTAPNLSPGFGLGSQLFRLDPTDARPPYMLQRAFQIQRQLPSNMLLSIAYVGNHGTRLQSRIDVNNEMPPQYLSQTINNGEGVVAAFLQPLNNPAIQALPEVASMPIDPATGLHAPFLGFTALYGAGQTLGQALRTFPQYTAGKRPNEGDGTSDYNSLQVNLNKRMSNGLTMLVSYTWAKTLTNAASNDDEFSGFDENSFNAKPEKTLSINDYPQNAVISFTYELPFGPGKKFISQGGVAGRIVGGWKFSGILNYQSGPPQYVSEGNNLAPYEGNNDNGDSFVRPNRLSGVPIGNPARHQKGFNPTTMSLLNPAAFVATPSPQQNPGLGWASYFGNEPGLLGGDGRRLPYLDEDVSLMKKTQVTERVNIEFRADFLNLFNRTVFGTGTGGDMYGSVLSNGVGNAGFGTMSSQSNTPREVQFGLKVNF